ncbi:unnamed protein product [Gongylonema pulchrum]|uniref:FAD-binding FR-type domain-containing protein n=1 Tax=Gongylonema pulchrum TaxID=637853 RepID=A0A183E3K6_9BILA|nr:unnamed protein product [Gongylonema pulchrum]
MYIVLEPERPHLEESGVGDDFISLVLTPGQFDKNEERPVGSSLYVKYRRAGDDEWETIIPRGKYVFLPVSSSSVVISAGKSI